MAKRYPLVPSLKDLCTKYVGENLGEIMKWSLHRAEDAYDDQPLLMSPFDFIRNHHYNQKI